MLICCGIPVALSHTRHNENKTKQVCLCSTEENVTCCHCSSSNSSSYRAAVWLQSEHLSLPSAKHEHSSCCSQLIDRPSTAVGCIITPALQLCCCCRRLFRCCRRPMSSKGPTGGSGVTRPSVILWYTSVESEATAHSSIGYPRSSTRRILHIRDSGGFWGNFESQHVR